MGYAANTPVRIMGYDMQNRPTWHERGTVVRARWPMPEREAVRFDDGGVLMVHRERLMADNAAR